MGEPTKVSAANQSEFIFVFIVENNNAKLMVLFNEKLHKLILPSEIFFATPNCLLWQRVEYLEISTVFLRYWCSTQKFLPHLVCRSGAEEINLKF